MTAEAARELIVDAVSLHATVNALASEAWRRATGDGRGPGLFYQHGRRDPWLSTWRLITRRVLRRCEQLGWPPVAEARAALGLAS